MLMIGVLILNHPFVLIETVGKQRFGAVLQDHDPCVLLPKVFRPTYTRLFDC
jgi:hypothetical protein